MSLIDLSKAKAELLGAEFIVVAPQYARNDPTLHAITWKKINECNGWFGFYM